MFNGLTWDHPRGYCALAEAERLVNASRTTPLIAWDKQPLEGFESAPIAELASRYELLVLDHPHIGEAVASDCLHPLEDFYSGEQIASWQAQSVGSSLESYAWQGKHYALPLDVATQVMARRPDRIATPPQSFAEICALARRLPVAQSLGGPHAFLTLISMVAAEGVWIGGRDMLPEAPARAALDMMHRLYAMRPSGSETLNPIELLELMSRGSEIALIPLIFGYVTYCGASVTHRLAFSDSLSRTGGAGGVLGGTGIAFTRKARPDPALLQHIAWLLDERTQRRLIPAFGGQPSARTAWRDQEVNDAWNGFYRNTRTSAETALLRPRFDGYIAFQSEASALLREAFETHERPEASIRKLRQKWRRARETARGDLDDERGTS